MSISSFSLFESAKKGLTANQVALTVVSQNVANASTEGYSRQEVLFKTAAPASMSNQVGSGVEVGEIRQIRDTYIDVQIRLQNEVSSYWDTNQNYLEKIQMFLSDNSDAGLRGLMDKLWKAAEDVSNSPQSQTTRLAMVQAGEAFTESVKSVAAQIGEVKASANSGLGQKVEQLNMLAKRIAEINSQISKFEKSGFKMNDLRDERARMINELSGLASISVSRSGDLDDAVIRLNGHPLVDGGSYDQIETEADLNGNLSLRWKSGAFSVSTNPQKVDAIVSAAAADGVYGIDVKSLAGGYRIFSKSYDMDKNSLLSAFGVKSGRVSINGAEIMIDAQKTTLGGLINLINASAAGVSAKLDSGGKLTLESNDTGAVSKITLADMESNLFEKIGLITAVGARPEPAISGADESLNISGTFMVNGSRITIAQGQTDSLNRIASEINSASETVAAKVARGSDGAYSLTLTSKDGVSKIEIEDGADNLLNRLGFLKSPQTKLTVGGVTAAGGSDAVFTINNMQYSSPVNKIKDAIAGVELSLNSTGAAQITAKPVLKGGAIGALLSVRDEAAPGYLEKMAEFVKTFASEFNAIHTSGYDLNGQAGLNFFNTLNGSALNTPQKIIDGFSVSAGIKNNPSKFAAAGMDEDYYSRTGVIRAMGAADNTAALKLTELKSKTVFSDGSTITDKYTEIVFRIGSQVEAAQKMNKTQVSILNNLELKKESVSGVSIDEEISNMMKFQHAYNASARMINVIDGMLDTIINRLMR
jgi:flagellar hook-associated protein FlgK